MICTFLGIDVLSAAICKRAKCAWHDSVLVWQATGGLWGGSMGQIDIDTYLMIKCFNSGEDVTFLSASQPPDAAASDQDP